MSAGHYGEFPSDRLGFRLLDWDEYMHWLYCPVQIGEQFCVPPNLEFARELIRDVIAIEAGQFEYVYVTARRGFATPGNPLNRPGWHCDGFGTDDVNYIWSDRWPTRFATGVDYFRAMPADHVTSVDYMESRTQIADVWSGQPSTLYRLSPYVVHCTPKIEAPGGERSFLKISLSNDRYNLRGNSHNYGLDYDWQMWDRSEVRNDPRYAGGDAGPQS